MHREEPTNGTDARGPATLFTELLSRHVQQAIARDAQRVELEAGQVAQMEGQACRTILIVESGEVRVFKISENGREICLYHVEPGEACALAICCAMTGRHYPVMAEALVPVTGWALPASSFLKLVASERELHRFVGHLLARRLIDLTSLVSEVAFDDVDQRLARYLLNRTTRAGPTVRSTHAAIAAELGTVREVVTRALETYSTHGWVSIGRGMVTIKDPSGLRSLLHGKPSRR